MSNYDYDYTKIKTGDYNYDYDYTKFGKADYDYDYNNHCNRLQMITITIVISPMPGATRKVVMQTSGLKGPYGCCFVFLQLLRLNTMYTVNKATS